MIRIYNTLSGSKEEFKPIESGHVRMYVCGPTVYNLIHIGNARPMIVFDTVRRYMEYKGLKVNYVSNFTDVDDKIINKAIEEGVSASEISTRYIEECKKDMKGMNIEPATCNPLATQEIDGMIEMISSLIEKGYAYEVEGTVYYSTRKFSSYGKLSKKNIDDLESGKRIAIEEKKKDPLDFVLWKPKKPGEPAWDSPWGEGRPGWHIECSVMSKKYLGDEIDIHAGGEDLVFPHHENEIAQSEAANGKQFSRYWMHNAFLNINNKKMSKSLNNFFTVRDISEKYDLQVLRFFMLNAHYRSPLNFSEELMISAASALDRIINACETLRLVQRDEGYEGKEEIDKKCSEYMSKFEASMEDDFNTADAIAAAFELIKYSNVALTGELSKSSAEKILNTIDTMFGICGIKTTRTAEKLEEKVEQLIVERQQARKNKDFKRADEIRDELLNEGIVLEDTREGVKWKKV